MKQKIKGGKGAKLNPKDVDKNQLAMGIKIEMEHTPSRQIAMEIAIDHLSEDPQYYTKLNKANLEEECTPCNTREFIEHVVTNWPYLKEANENKERTIKRFEDEADDLGVKISRAQVQAMIKRFEELKNGLPAENRDIQKYTIKQLLKLVSAAGYKSGTTADEAPPANVAYDQGGIHIWSGHTRDNCILYGRGRSWCIAQSGNTNWARYRYADEFPSFYIAKNDNLPETDVTHHIAVQVQQDGDYKWTNSKNSPGMSRAMSWNELVQEVPWLEGKKDALKYIPLNSQERMFHVYSKTSTYISNFIHELDFEEQQKYLIARKNNTWFSDIDNGTFIRRVLPKYPKLETWLSRDPYVLGSNILLNIILPNIEVFSDENKASISKNLRNTTFSTNKEFLDFLEHKGIDFNTKSYFIKKELYPKTVGYKVYYYIHPETGNIVRIDDNGQELKLSILDTDNDYYPNVKINRRTEKYLSSYPKLTDISLSSLTKTASEKDLSNEFKNELFKLSKTIETKYKYSKEINDVKYFIDLESFTFARTEPTLQVLDKENVRIPELKNEVLTKLRESPEIFTDFIVPLIKDKKITFSKLWLAIDGIKYKELEFEYGRYAANRILLPNIDNTIIVLDHKDFSQFNGTYETVYSSDFEYGTANQTVTEATNKIYGIYYRSKNKSLSSQDIRTWVENRRPSNINVAKILLHMPISPASNVRPVITRLQGEEIVGLYNEANPIDSYVISPKSGKRLGWKARAANIAPAPVAGRVAAPAPGVNQNIQPGVPPAGANPIRGRGRPPGVPNRLPPQNQPAPWELPAAPPRPAVAPPANAGNVPPPPNATMARIFTGYGLNPQNQMGIAYRRMLPTTFQEFPLNTSRGVARRNNMLAGRGRVIRNYQSGATSLYIIQMNSGVRIASLVVQPGNMHYLILPDRAISLNDPASLPQVLTAQNINENIKTFITNEYIEACPKHKHIIKQMLIEHLNIK